MPNVLLIGGRGNIGSGLRTYLPKLDPTYQFTSVDLPGAPDKATATSAQDEFVYLDICAHPDQLSDFMQGRDLVVYLARKSPHEAMNQMTDLVFEALLKQNPVPMVIASSSIHAVDGAYSVDEGVLSILSERRFDDIPQMPERMLTTLPATPDNPYAREKKHVEEWIQRVADRGHSAIAARWGGINAQNKMAQERGYFSLWCHQEDAAQFVHACYTTYKSGTLKSGAHYFVVSDNTYNIFDIEIQRQEIGYNPVHNSESFYE
ncbi:MAG: NAD(P)-dependent oxidoreductase [Candidatus Latescibacteria bacterium]|jgi:nucleoside-diphosphate-sugar epimerase|nr:NAD(P)-dependent oxidoreductase [Candidatus Latescibacterota bacterium]MBT4136522.1 NAD(P)-dependent oxidoreductase [Candidatus Latescibacterota bacterium]MBT5828837.1 NAD(P)-dependent oxidoreductase [Candidatus Latescibacterota bacterium]